MSDTQDIQDDSPSEDFLNTPLATGNDVPVIETEETPAYKGSDDTTKDEEQPKQDEAESTEAKEEPKEGEEPTPEPQTDDTQPEKGKPDPERARQAYMERQHARANITRTIDDNYAPKTAEDIINENDDIDPNEARYQALEERLNFEQQRGQITELNATLQTEAVNVEADFPVFNPKSDTYDADFTKLVEDAYQDSANLKFDDNGIVLHAGKPLYDFYQKMANIHSRGAAKDSEKRQQEAIQMAARIEPVGGSSSTSSNRDSSEEFLEKYGNMPIV